MSSSVKCVDIATEKRKVGIRPRSKRNENRNRDGGGSVNRKICGHLRFVRDRNWRQQRNLRNTVGDMEIEISCNEDSVVRQKVIITRAGHAAAACPSVTQDPRCHTTENAKPLLAPRPEGLFIILRSGDPCVRSDCVGSADFLLFAPRYPSFRVCHFLTGGRLVKRSVVASVGSGPHHGMPCQR